MRLVHIFKDQLAEVNGIAKMGFAAGFHIEYTKATYMLQSYPMDWITYYAENGLLLSDPTVNWGFENDGHIDWQNLKSVDPNGVIDKAASFGLRHGVTCGKELNGLRSIASFSRDDRNFTAEETEILFESFGLMMDATKDRTRIGTDTVNEIKSLGITLQQNVI